MEWSSCLASIRPLKNGNMVTRRRAFTRFRDGCVRLDIAAFSTLTWQIPHQIPSTGELDIELSQKLFAIALSDVRPTLDSRPVEQLTPPHPERLPVSNPPV